MSDMYKTTTLPAGDIVEPHCSVHKHAVCWSSIFAGVIGTVVISFVLFVLASSYGLVIASPWSGEGMSATAVGANAAIALIIIQWASSAFGGFLTGRLRPTWRVNSDEVCFRDSVHGFLTWALGTLVMVVLLNSAVMSVVQGGAAGATVAAATSDTRTIGDRDDSTAYFVDSLFRTETPSDTVSSADTRLEATRILLKSFSEEGMKQADRAYLSRVVSARADVSLAEAERRVDNTVTEMKEATDTARKTAATLAIFTFLSLVIGAFIASVAALMGGRCRDECVY